MMFLVVMVIVWPVVIIWAWNTLFGSMHFIDYTFTNWLAVVVFNLWRKASIKTETK
jgi:hypothetical protein